MTAPTLPGYISVDAAAERLQRPATFVRDALRKGRLTGRKVFGRLLLGEVSVNALAAKLATKAPNEPRPPKRPGVKLLPGELPTLDAEDD